MASEIAGEAADIVDNDDTAFLLMLAQIGKKQSHGRPVLFSAGQHLPENVNNLIPFEARILTAARFLRSQAASTSLGRVPIGGVTDGWSSAVAG
ncbi:hypothetical protein E8M01_06585 [Phreatobacter stygius]|uniref:Uncharacterized protein n=1 Tax=Phreatobacter stygius TaxID=1940610 RepID=A0A4D7AVU0_9HYPH|nr:hypothetical protein [Phreatobacter stygius]QCI63941.1 hypothetical protein E8M01_06585 [Phreatobacter stygius]